ncbi:MAG: zinc-dependent alcohol dehydrogenase family protein [Allobranchiibius sp.]
MLCNTRRGRHELSGAPAVKALLYEEFGMPPTVRNVADPTCPRDGVVIEVRATGLCRSDWHGWAGHDRDIVLPHVPGHEFAGVVVEAGPETGALVGQRVTSPFVCGCGVCRTCLAGAPQVCENQFQPGFTGWGSFAELVALPHADLNLVEIPADLDFATAAALGCRFATAYRAVTAHARVRPGDWVVIFGCGGVGLSATMIAASRGGRVIAVDSAAPARELAGRFGAEVLIDATEPHVVERVRELTNGGARASIDALGSRLTCRAAIETLARRGRHIQVGLLFGDDAHGSVPMDRVIAHELEIYGSHGMAAADYPAMLAEIATGALRPQSLVTAKVGLEQLAGPRGALAVMGERPPTGVTVVVF